MEFQNKTALITGGASGIGFLTAKCMAKEGASVLLVDINETALIEKTKEINADGVGKADYVVCDVREYDQVVTATDKAVELFGRLDILINCAGGCERRCRALQHLTGNRPQAGPHSARAFSCRGYFRCTGRSERKHEGRPCQSNQNMYGVCRPWIIQ